MMTPELRIAQLETELARERARADGLQEIVHALTVKTRSRGAERQARYREAHKAMSVTSDVTVTRNSDVTTPTPSSSPPPSFSLSPPSEPSPSILYPFSPASPPPPPAASQATASAAPLAGDELPDATAEAEEGSDRPSLVLVAQEGPRKAASATEAKPRPPQPGLVLYERLEAARAVLCEARGVAFVPSRWPYSRQNRDLGPIARLPEGHEEQGRFAAAWDAFVEDPVALTREPPFSLDWFWKCRSRYEGRAVQAGGGT